MLPSHSTLPTPAPSFAPTAVPSSMPSSIPSTVPTALPSAMPTPTPSRLPSSMPSFVPSAVPAAAHAPAVGGADVHHRGALADTDDRFAVCAANVGADAFADLQHRLPLPVADDRRPDGGAHQRPVADAHATHRASDAGADAPDDGPLGRADEQADERAAPAPTIPAPSAAPTFATELPTPLSWPPTPLPSSGPSSLPSSAPTTPPTAAPSSVPSPLPSAAPTSEPTLVPAPAPTPRPVALSPTRVPTAAPSRVPTAAPSGAPTAHDASRRPTYVPTALPSGKPSVPPTSMPSSTPTSPWPTPAATNFTGFNYRSTLTCVTGPLPANATYVNGVSARPRVRTRLRTGTTLVVRTGTSGFVATQSEAGCRFATTCGRRAYRIFIGFYNAKTRSLEDYYDKNHLTVANADGAADFIESYEARDDLIFVVFTTYRYEYLEWEPRLPAALKRCGATSALHKLTADRTNSINGQYILVSQCGKGVAWASQHGLEASAVDTGTALEMEVDIDSKFELYNGDAHARFNFTYAPELTPTLQSVSRLNGTTAGGTTLKLNVTGIRKGLATVENTTVTLGGVLCAIQLSDVATYRDQHLCDWDGVNCDNLGITFHNETNTTMITCLTVPLGLFRRRARGGDSGESVAVGPRAEPESDHLGLCRLVVVPDDVGRRAGK